MGITHKWNGTILEITSDSGTTAMDLKGAKGDTGARGARGLTGAMGGGAMIEDGVISEETTWSSAAIMDNFAEGLSVSGNPVSCNPIPNYPLHIITNIEPKQSGSGEASPNNIRPISGMGEVNVTRCGRNLAKIIDKEVEVYNGITWSSSNGAVTATGTATDLSVFNYYVSLPAGDYIFTGCPSGGNMDTGYFIRIIGNELTLLNDDGKGGLFSLETPTEITIRMVVRSGNTVNNVVFKPMVRIATDTDTTYEPYNGNTFTMYLGENYYGGSIDWNRGELIVNKYYMEFSGDNEGWEHFDTAQGKLKRLWVSPAPVGVVNEAGLICSHYAPTGFSIRTDKSVYASMGHYIDIIDNDYVADTWDAYLQAQATAGTPVSVCYELAEPYTIELTAQEISAIKDTNTLYTDADNLQVIGRVDTMKQLSELAARVAALETALINA